MTTETIRDVLARILTINKNLTTESLKSLLEASGWDANDIKEGMRIYNNYTSSGNDIKDVSEEALEDALEKMDEVKEINNELVNKEKVIMPTIKIDKEIEDKLNAKTPSPTDAGDTKQVQDGIIKLNQEVMDLSIDKDKIPSIQKDAADIASNDNKIQDKAAEKLEAPAHVMTLEEEVHDIDAYVHTKPWALIILNSALFLVVLLLLLYIILA